ncbi:MAG: DMT family transporter, partial [Thermoleophilia bacterium]|nr:DMT family transporter [Thermoleophilia bacterium]
YTSVVSSVVIVTTTPLWVALASPVTLKEPITKRIIFGLVTALGGTILIGFGDACEISASALVCPPTESFFQQGAVIGDLLALVGAWTAAGYVIIGRSLRDRLGLVPYISVVYSMAAVILGVMMVISGEKFWGFPPLTWLWLILLGIVPQLIGHSTFNWSLGFLPASIVAVTLLGEPVGSSILAYIFLGETPGISTIIGGVMILAGIFIASTNIGKSDQIV